MRFMCFEDYVRRGTSRDFHGALGPEDRELYHQCPASHTALIVREIVDRARLPKGASDLLYLGGGHGLYAFTFCEKCPNPRAEVLDLDRTFATSTRSQLGQLSHGRVRFTAGDLRDITLTDACCDAMLMANVLHHLDGRNI
jgi:ubiquinone/menaquinone biosynthesis C-methylase UbiE